jgi:signal transduction histidine kinase
MHGLWLGTHGKGIAYIHGGTITKITQFDGLPSDVICGLQWDNQGDLWASTLQGIVRLRFNNIGTPPKWTGKPEILVMDESDGMTSRECAGGDQSPVIKRQDGSLWFSTLRGVAMVQPERLIRNNIIPTTVIEAFVVDNEVQSTGAPITLAAGRHSLEFHFTSTSLSAAERNRFRYRLEGFDMFWIETRDRRSANYTNLPAGHYRLRVMASNNDGVWSKQEAQLEFSIERPFYRTWWFFTLLFITAAGTLWSLYQLRAREHRAKHAVLNERLRISRELHDKLSQTMTGVVLQLDAADHALQDNPPTAAPYVRRAAELAREGIHETRRTLQGLPPADLDDNGLVDALHRNILRCTQGTTVNVKVSVVGEARTLSPEVELELFRIGQEATTNALMHGKAQEIQVVLMFNELGVHLVLTDNGTGFDMDAKDASTGMGLRSMRERVASLRGTVSITSSPGNGTTVDAFVPADRRN